MDDEADVAVAEVDFVTALHQFRNRDDAVFERFQVISIVEGKDVFLLGPSTLKAKVKSPLFGDGFDETVSHFCLDVGRLDLVKFRSVEGEVACRARVK